MFSIRRSVDVDKDVLWIACELNPATHVNRHIYVGKDVNDCIKAAVAGGMGKDEAVNQAISAVERAKQNEVCDTIK